MNSDPSGNAVNDLTPLEAALIYAQAGRLVLPLLPLHKRPYIKWGVESLPPGDVPDEETIRAWWEQWPEAGVGMRTDGLFVIDIDLPDGPASLLKLKQCLGGLPATKNILSGSGGRHLLFRISEQVAEQTPQATELGGLTNLDSRVGTKGIIALPPTLHRSGTRYRWRRYNTQTAFLSAERVELMTPSKAPPTSIPATITDTATPLGRAALKSEAARVMLLTEGSRTNGLNRAAFRMGQLVHSGDLPYDAAATALEEAGLYIELSPTDVHDNVRSGLNAGIQRPRED